MTDNDRPQFLTKLFEVAAVHRVDTPDAWIAGYWSALKDLTLADFCAGLAEAAKAEKFMPVPATIRAAAPGTVNHAESWGQVRAAIRKFGYPRGADARKTLTGAQWAAVNTLGGWLHLCELDTDELDHLGRVYKDAIAGAEAKALHAKMLAPKERVAIGPTDNAGRLHDMIRDLANRGAPEPWPAKEVTK